MNIEKNELNQNLIKKSTLIKNAKNNETRNNLIKKILKSNDLSFISIIYGVSGKVHLYQLKSDSEIYPDLKNAKDGNEHTECQYFKLTDLPEISKDLKKVLEILL